MAVNPFASAPAVRTVVASVSSSKRGGAGAAPRWELVVGKLACFFPPFVRPLYMHSSSSNVYVVGALIGFRFFAGVIVNKRSCRHVCCYGGP